MLSPRYRLYVLSAFLALLALSPGGLPGVADGVVLAEDDDDDDGGDDDDDDDDDDDRGGSDDDDDSSSSSDGGTVFRAPQKKRTPQAEPRVEPLPVASSDEVVVWGLGAPERAAVLAAGYTVVAERAGLPSLILLAVPGGETVDGAIAEIAALAPAALAAPNSFYRNQTAVAGCEADICDSWTLVGWEGATAGAMCAFSPFIGVVDTGVNLEHDMLRAADVTVHSLGTHAGAPSSAKHGTAIVAMLVGDPAGRVPGLVPDAKVRVADPFGLHDGDERADTFGLVSAIDHLVEEEVDVVNLSLAGPANVVLEASVGRAVEAGIPVVAAVGNAGASAEALYPAAYEPVVAVTAVDSSKRVYRRAVQGGHVDFAAPGVEIATAASISGVRPQTGTSFAVPFVTVAVAAGHAVGAPDVIEHLAGRSEDLGEVGYDTVFGHGLIQIDAPC